MPADCHSNLVPTSLCLGLEDPISVLVNRLHQMLTFLFEKAPIRCNLWQLRDPVVRVVLGPVAEHPEYVYCSSLVKRLPEDVHRGGKLQDATVSQKRTRVAGRMNLTHLLV